jgi:hypothetical protein
LDQSDLDSPFHRFAGATDVAGLPLQSVADLDGVVVRMDAGRWRARAPGWRPGHLDR